MANRIIHYLSDTAYRDWISGLGEDKARNSTYMIRSTVHELLFLCGRKNSLSGHVYKHYVNGGHEHYYPPLEDQSTRPFPLEFTCRFSDVMSEVTCKKCIKQDTNKKAKMIIAVLEEEIEVEDDE